MQGYMPVLSDGRDRQWMDDAVCRTHPDPDLWHPSVSDVYSPEVREAGRICGTCPVRFQCLEYGKGERSGIYGGVLMSGPRAIPIPAAKAAAEGRLPAARPTRRPVRAATKPEPPRPAQVPTRVPVPEPVAVEPTPVVEQAVEAPAAVAVAVAERESWGSSLARRFRGLFR